MLCKQRQTFLHINSGTSLKNNFFPKLHNNPNKMMASCLFLNGRLRITYQNGKWKKGLVQNKRYLSSKMLRNVMPGALALFVVRSRCIIELYRQASVPCYSCSHFMEC